MVVGLAIIAGVSLTATAVSWWNGRCTEQVHREIESLEANLGAIYAADAKKRQKLIFSYVLSLEKLVDQELSIRNEVATELVASHSKARDIMRARFGSREKNSFLQLVLELDMALSRIDAERAYLTGLKEVLHEAKSGGVGGLPSPGELFLPNDYPKEGGLVHFNGSPPEQLHGYRLKSLDWSDELGGRAMLFSVDHKRRVAKVSVSRAALLEANLTDGGGAIEAKAVRRENEGIYFNYMNVELLLPCSPRELSWILPESTIEVYPEIWPLTELVKLDPEEPLQVRLHPRVEGSRKYWSPILLSVDEEKLAMAVGVYDKIAGIKNDPPWRIHIRGDSICFTLGDVTLVTAPDRATQSFKFDSVEYGKAKPEMALLFHAQLSVYIPGTEDDAQANRSLFLPFIQAIHSELSSQKQMLLQRQAAMRLRKLSLIYQDQEEYLQAEGSVGFLPGEFYRNGREVIGMVMQDPIPVWFEQIANGKDNFRMQAVGHIVSWPVQGLEWVDKDIGSCKISLVVPSEATFMEINPRGITRLELAGEGTQQQTLSKALESAVLGRFRSGAVHSSLLGLPGDLVENANLGRDMVESVLSSDEPVVAIWGPPGTGKTTLLVSWLSSIFHPEKKDSWPTVLITAPTHVAVTKLVTDLIEKLPFLSDEVVRYGASDKVLGTGLEEVWHETLLADLYKHRELAGDLSSSVKQWRNVIRTREGREAAAKWLIGSRHIHAVTCVGMARRDYGLSRREFDIAIIDEAGKAFGAELMLPAAVSRRLVMVGDHKQLPPTITTDELREEIGYRLSMGEVESLLNENMFKTIFDQLPSEAKGMLVKQYRMHKDIGDIVSEMFYDGRLESVRDNEAWGLSRSRLVFVDFSKVACYRHEKDDLSPSIVNSTERAAVFALLARMNDMEKFRGLSILLVCPYEAQRRVLSEELIRKSFVLDICVSTVDAVQGGEANIVILMMTRTFGDVQFLLDKHRLNVALSRARDAVIIFGHVECLTRVNDSPFTKLIEFGNRNETIECLRLKSKVNFEKDIAEKILR